MCASLLKSCRKSFKFRKKAGCYSAAVKKPPKRTKYCCCCKTNELKSSKKQKREKTTKILVSGMMPIFLCSLILRFGIFCVRCSSDPDHRNFLILGINDGVFAINCLANFIIFIFLDEAFREKLRELFTSPVKLLSKPIPKKRNLNGIIN